MAELTLEELHAGNIVAANSLTLKPGQDRFMLSDSYTQEAPRINPADTWPRVIVDEDRVVGYIMGHFSPDYEKPEFRSMLWQINVAGTEQGRGIGRFAAEELAAEAARRGLTEVTVLWEPGDAGPEAFFLKLGFTPVGETSFGEVIGSLSL